MVIPPNADAPPKAEGGFVRPVPNKDGLVVVPLVPNAPPEEAGAEVVPPV